MAENLKNLLAGLGDLVVMFSGGLDSLLLTDLAHEVLAEKMAAFTIDSPTVAPAELQAARSFCQERGIAHHLIAIDETANKEFSANPPERCYICRKLRDQAVIDRAQKNGFNHIADGMNCSDLDDYRPGLKAAEEDGILHPFISAGLDKPAIRDLARMRNLPGWDREPTVGLCSRIAYGTVITPARLRRIAAGEKFLKELGLKGLRLRCFDGDRAVIECNDFETIIARRAAISAHLLGLGFSFVSLDLEGRQSGRLNRGLE